MNFQTIRLLSLILTLVSVFLFSACAKKRNTNAYTNLPPIEDTEIHGSPDSITDDVITSDTIEEEIETQDIDGLEVPLLKQKIPNKILKRYAYTVSYNKTTRCPNWVAWKLTADHTDGPYNRSDYKFHEDMDVPSPRAYYHDYSRNGVGLERGHMCPAGDNKWSDRAMNESHLLSNICPQNGNLNGGEWKYLEEDCREWAKTYSTIYIACGPIFYNKNHNTIGDDKIAVPDAFFKVVLRLGKNPQALGFIYPNRACNGGKASYILSVDDVEKVVGMDFFSSLDDKVENKVEQSSNLELWN